MLDNPASARVAREEETWRRAMVVDVLAMGSVIRIALGWVIDWSSTPIAQKVTPSHLASTQRVVEPEDRGKGSGMQELTRTSASLAQETSFFVIVLFPFMMTGKGAV